MKSWNTEPTFLTKPNRQIHLEKKYAPVFRTLDWLSKDIPFVGGFWGGKPAEPMESGISVPDRQAETDGMNHDLTKPLTSRSREFGES